MRHTRDMINAEQWNPRVNKGSLENYDMENTLMRHDYNNVSVEDPSPNPAISQQLNSGMQDHSAGHSDRETAIPENIEKIQPSSGQAVEKTAPLVRKDEKHYAKATPSSFDAFRKKRRNRRSKFWIFLPLGLLISIVSGIAMAYWMSHDESEPDLSLQANYIEEREPAYDENVDMVLRGEDEDYIPDEGDTAIENEDVILDSELYAEMADDEGIFGDTEYAEDDLADFAGEDSSFDEDVAIEPLLSEKKDTSKETGTLLVKKESVADEKISAAKSALREDVNSKDKGIHKEVLENTAAPEPAIEVNQAEVKTAAVVNVVKKQAAAGKEIESSGAENELDNAEPHEISDKEPLQPALAQEKESVSTPVITALIMSDVIDTETVENTRTAPESPLHSSDGLSLRSKVKIPSRADNVMGEQNNTVKTIGKVTIPSKPEVTREDAGNIDAPAPVAASVQGPPAMNADIKALQTGISSSLKEMLVNYEDRFNGHNNKWPEYEDSKASAVIASGEYHIENRAGIGTHALIHPVGVPMNMDFMIDVSIGSVYRSGENAYGFVFGAKDTRNTYAFLIRNGHLYAIEKMSNGSSTEIAGGQIENTFIRGDSQKSLKIVKRQNKMRFYIDGHFVDEIADVDYFGDKTGFLVRGKVKMSVDRIHTQIRYQK